MVVFGSDCLYSRSGGGVGWGIDGGSFDGYDFDDSS